MKTFILVNAVLFAIIAVSGLFDLLYVYDAETAVGLIMIGYVAVVLFLAHKEIK